MTLDLPALLALQKAAQRRDGSPTAAERIARLDKCIGLLVDYRAEIEAALDADFGARSKEATAFTDVASSIGTLKHAKAHVKTWMRPERRRPTPAILGLFGARAEVRFQPKGVVGIISPWNFPVNLTFTPLAGVLAAGNRAMIKPSEFTPATSELMARMFASAFSPEEIVVAIGGADVGQEFSGLAFDHLIFTGATSVASHVMRAAAEHLTPLTLELGGKSPVIIGRSADMKIAAARIMNGKTLNAGQICLAPDYVLVPRDRMDAFIDEARGASASMFPTLKDNPDYTSVINQRHFDRLTGYVEEARGAGARVVELKPDTEDLNQQEHRKIAPTLIIDPGDDLKVMQEEIFGPVLPVKPYDRIDEALAYVNDHPRPLGLYYFGTDAAERDSVLERTTAGGVTVNDVVFHVAQEDLPFGGVGPSGMGSYHGRDGFLEFSHAKAIYSQIKTELPQLKALRPPYGPSVRKYLLGAITK